MQIQIAGRYNYILEQESKRLKISKTDYCLEIILEHLDKIVEKERELLVKNEKNKEE